MRYRLLLGAIGVALCIAAAGQPIRPAQPTAEAPKIPSLKARSAMLPVRVESATLDPLNATLRVDFVDDATDVEAGSYIVYRVGDSGRWTRLAPDAPTVDVTELGNGTHTLQLRRVCAGMVHQQRPTDFNFTIAREEATILLELSRCLGSRTAADQALAVAFLSKHWDAYGDRLKSAGDLDHRESFLVEAARQKSLQRKSTPTISALPVRTLVQNVGEIEAWDFSDVPEANPWHELRSLTADGPLSNVNAMALDIDTLWFTHQAGVGAVDVRTQECRWYGTEKGIPAAPSGGICVALNGDIYTGTERGLAYYDAGADRFRIVAHSDAISVKKNGMIVDYEGRIWLLDTRVGAEVHIYDETQWIHQRIPMIRGLTRDVHGTVWFTGKEPQYTEKLHTLFPRARPKDRARDFGFVDIQLYADYLNNPYHLTSERNLRSGRYLWPQGDGGARLLEEFGGSLVPDPVNQEVWSIRDGFLVNESDGKDPTLGGAAPRMLPLPPGMAGAPQCICYVDDRHVYLGTSAGLNFHDGQGWTEIVPPRSLSNFTARDWPRWPQPPWYDETLFRYQSRSRIEIRDPFIGRRAPAGRYYEIVTRQFLTEYALREDTADGEMREYEFKPPFGHEPHILYADYEGNIWASGTHYVYRFDGHNISTYVAANHEHFGNDHIYSLSPDRHGNVWIGTEVGLCLFREGRFVPQEHKINGKVFSLVYDYAGDRLIATSSSGGIDIRQNGEWTHYGAPFADVEGQSHFVRSIAVAPDGTLWLATNAGALSFSHAQLRWIKYGRRFTHSIVLGGNGEILVNDEPGYMLEARGALDTTRPIH